MKRSSVTTALLEIGYFEAGAAGGPVAILLHGFPYDAHACIEAADMLAADGWHVFAPWLRGYGPTRFLSPETMRSGEQAALGSDLRAFMDALGIERATLAGYDWGGRAACVVAALWPTRVAGLVSANGYNLFHGDMLSRPAPPEIEARFWYAYYLHSPRGAAGLAQNRRAYARLLWEQWSPGWDFDDATFDRSAEAFDNPDFVDVVVHSYRHRYNMAAGSPDYAEVEARLFAQPVIDVPAIILTGEDGTLSFSPDTSRFARLIDNRRVSGGHNLIQENPRAILDAFRRLRRDESGGPSAS